MLYPMMLINYATPSLYEKGKLQPGLKLGDRSVANAIRGKVAQILNSREVVLNVGSHHGVEINMHFDILDVNLERILDPDTQQVIGSISRPKVRVRIAHVDDKLSIASTYKQITENVGGNLGVALDVGLVARAFLPPKWNTRYETLATDEKTWEDLDESASYINTGDPVVQVFESED